MKVGIIGFGNMGRAIAERIKLKYQVLVFDKDASKTKALKKIEVVKELKELIKRSEVIVLAVKPQDFDFLLDEIKGQVNDKLIISIAAGITTGYIEKILGTVRVIRAMPNIGAIVGESISYVCKGNFAKEADLKLSMKFFNYIGHSFIFAEDMMNAATAVGGSGPGFWGYLFDKRQAKEFIPELTSAAISVGFDKQTAESTASLVAAVSKNTASALKITPIQLTEKVASKGGTTEAGLEELKKGGSLTDAVKAALKRAEELSKRS